MTSRSTLPEQAVRSRASLVAALRAPGDNTDLIAQRARHLLRCKPHGADRDSWLVQVLPEAWHAEKTTAALAAQNGGSTNGTAQASRTEEVPVATTSRRSGRRRSQR